MFAWLERLRIDPYLLAILTMVGIATVLPCRGQVAVDFSYGTTIMIGLVFFFYGARLSREAVWKGLSHWRLHALILASTFVLFPLLGLAARVLVPTVLTPQLYLGVLFLCTLPSTVQSSIAFTGIARGNIPAAVCAASASSLLGIFITPLLVSLAMHAEGSVSAGSVESILLQLLAPFVAGQVARRWIGDWVGRNKQIISLLDRGSILAIVYTAFSEGVVSGIWQQLDPLNLAAVLLVNIALLAIVLTVTTFVSRRLGFSREDEITIVFCGSKKSLASGVPMVNVLFPPQTVGLIVVPLILYHQIQLMVCAALARRYAARPAVEQEKAASFPALGTAKAARG
ncbi:MAG TPA: bile acid:sodium symporter family protein [Aliidongia sp.]|nr:bile acid:sodium symporter family protein [Aliidongia sp.]